MIKRQTEVEETPTTGNGNGSGRGMSSIDFLSLVSSLLSPSDSSEPNPMLFMITSRLHSMLSSVQSFFTNSGIGQLSIFRRLRPGNTDEVEFIQPVVKEIERIKRTLEVIQAIQDPEADLPTATSGFEIDTSASAATSPVPMPAMPRSTTPAAETQSK